MGMSRSGSGATKPVGIDSVTRAMQVAAGIVLAAVAVNALIGS
jgi:hypothetical protein